MQEKLENESFSFFEILDFLKNSLLAFVFFNQLWFPVSYINPERWTNLWEIKLLKRFIFEQGEKLLKQNYERKCIQGNVLLIFSDL